MATEAITIEQSRARLIEALDVFQETKDPCADGHVEHGPEAHLGRRLVHTMSMAGMAIGADWDYEAAVAFIEAADLVVRTVGWTAATGHGGAARNDGRLIAFATKGRPE